jgi:YD repeat-containing protein
VAGNLTGDGTTTYGYDALGRLTGTSASGQARNYAYNGDGTLVSASANGTSTAYTQDLASGLSQVLAAASGGATSDYLRDDGGSLLAKLTSGARTWYGLDNQGADKREGSPALSMQAIWSPGQAKEHVLGRHCAGAMCPAMPKIRARG